MRRTFVPRHLPIIRTSLGFLLVCCATIQPVDAQITLVGAAKIDITPEQPVRMYGYGSRQIESMGIAGRLKAKALALGGTEGNEIAVLLTVDSGDVPEEVREEVFRRIQAHTPLKRERFMLCNSHNHSCPDLTATSPVSDAEQVHLTAYAELLTNRLEKVVLDAIAARQPGRLSWTQGSVDFAMNRRTIKDGKWTGFGCNADAPVDHSLPLLRITDAKNQLLAIVVNYACHCTTLRGNFKQIHGDWAACAQEYIEADNPGAVALVTIGCGGDSDPCPHGTVKLCEQHGRAMADEVKRLLQGEFKPIEPTLVALTEPLEIAYHELPPLDKLKQRAGPSWALGRLVGHLERGEKPPQSQTVQISTWVFGDDLAMVFLSDEPVADYALRIKREMDGSRLWINAYTNDITYYIASERVLKEGGYEAVNSVSNTTSYGFPNRVQPSIEDRIVERVRSLLPAEFTKK